MAVLKIWSCFGCFLFSFYGVNSLSFQCCQLCVICNCATIKQLTPKIMFSFNTRFNHNNNDNKKWELNHKKTIKFYFVCNSVKVKTFILYYFAKKKKYNNNNTTSNNAYLVKLFFNSYYKKKKTFQNVLCRFLLNT